MHVRLKVYRNSLMPLSNSVYVELLRNLDLKIIFIVVILADNIGKHDLRVFTCASAADSSQDVHH